MKITEEDYNRKKSQLRSLIYKNEALVEKSRLLAEMIIEGEKRLNQIKEDIKANLKEYSEISDSLSRFDSAADIAAEQGILFQEACEILDKIFKKD